MKAPFAFGLVIIAALVGITAAMGLAAAARATPVIGVSASGLAAGSSTTTNAASPRKWLWTESYTEKILTKNLRIPCKYVRQTRQACDVAAAQARVDSWNASMDSCNSLPTPEQQYQCLQFLITTSHVVQTLENVKRGFALQSVDCIGSGPGIRFSLLRCRVTVLDRDIHTNQPEQVSGRIAVTTTGRATFRWVLI